MAAILAPAACSVGGSSLASDGTEIEIPAPDAGAKGGASGKAGSGGSAGKKPDAGAGAKGDASDDAPSDAKADAEPFIDATPDVVVEPDGTPVLRFLHGVADTKAVRLCVSQWGSSGPVGTSQPSDEIPFGAAIDVPIADRTLSYRAAVVGGDAAALAKLDCASVFTMPPAGVRVMPLPIIPAGTLTAPRSLLLVAAGCLGGATVVDPAAVCSQLGSPTQLAPAFALVELSRVVPPDGFASVQVIHASSNLPSVKAVLVSSETEARDVVSLVDLGEITPKPPKAIDPAWLGALPKGARFEVRDAANDQAFSPLPLGEELAASGLDVAGFVAGKRFVVVVIGSRPSIADAGPPVPLRRTWLTVD